MEKRLMEIRKRFGVTKLEARRVGLQFTDEQWEEFHRLGDVNYDGYINITDLEIIDANYGWIGEPGENLADVNYDGEVDMRDSGICAGNQGLDIWTYFGVPKEGVNFQDVAVSVVVFGSLTGLFTLMVWRG